MSKARHGLIVAMSSILLLSSAAARPITDADLFNKNICWNNDDTQAYHADHKFDDRFAGTGTWRIGATGIQWRGQTWGDDYWVEIVKDGMLTATNGRYFFIG